MNLASRIFGNARPEPEQRAGVVELYPTWANQATEEAPRNFEQLVERVYARNPVIFRAVMARMMLFSEVRFAYRRMKSKELFTTPSLRILERPWPNGTTGELLKRMEQDASFSGNAYIYKAAPNLLQRLRPDRVQVLSNRSQPVGYAYWPNGIGQGQAEALTLEEVAHYTPIPHPTKNWLGISWVQAVLQEVMADGRMTGHQDRFYRNAATPNLFVKVESQLTQESRERLKEELDRRYGGWENAYKTIVLDGGADLKAVGADFQQADFVASRESNENRIAIASGVPASILGLAKAREGGALSTSFEVDLKQFAITLRDLWRSSADALSSIVTVPRDAELWWDESEVAALQDNAKSRADIKQQQAATINTLITAGYEPDSVIKAIETGDFAELVHTGLFSVQLQPAGSEQEQEEEGESFPNDEDEGDGGAVVDQEPAP